MARLGHATGRVDRARLRRVGRGQRSDRRFWDWVECGGGGGHAGGSAGAAARKREAGGAGGGGHPADAGRAHQRPVPALIQTQARRVRALAAVAVQRRHCKSPTEPIAAARQAERGRANGQLRAPSSWRLPGGGARGRWRGGQRGARPRGAAWSPASSNPNRVPALPAPWRARATQQAQAAAQVGRGSAVNRAGANPEGLTFAAAAGLPQGGAFAWWLGLARPQGARLGSAGERLRRMRGPRADDGAGPPPHPPAVAQSGTIAIPLAARRVSGRGGRPRKRRTHSCNCDPCVR